MTYLPNRERENDFTSNGGGANYMHVEGTVDNAPPVVTTTASSGEVIINAKKRNSVSYKTEWEKMRVEKQKWLYRFCIATAVALAELFLIIIMAP